ncbi:PAAR domain-containing protein [Burkholderia sp. Ac-20384]|uniref:PAAR domain-containing protein n=1 Tax=Burkholderia TaxID=32008 RepID=UPI001581745D|nr:MULTISPECIES: PAAR domain-containing protein [Burkholderia]MBN3823974.1 PAAR domain-containing protein [Burkholderia sp. Ac-20384]
MRRSYLKIGDKSSVGGIVIDGIPGMTHGGTELTFLGAKVQCPACQSLGIITARGPRWPGSMMGKERALENDLCVCKCSPPPVMIASQSEIFEEFEGGALASMGFAENGESIQHALNEYDQHFRIINSDGEPVEGLPYLLKSADGTIVKGVTSTAGITELVSANDAHEVQFLLHIARDE